VAIVSQDVQRQAAVTIRTLHTTRYGFLLRIEGLADVQPPFIITDALKTSVGGFYELDFSPHGSDIIWASHYDPENGGDILVYPVASEVSFGRIHFTGKTSAFVMVFGTSDSPAPRVGDSFSFPDDPEAPLGKIQSARLRPARELDYIFID
jgi:hypothetical protein